MIVHLYAACWNEEMMIPFFLRHYENVVDKIFIYDDHSTDKSKELLTAHPKVVWGDLNLFSESDKRHSADFVYFNNNIWKNSIGEADWVIICNIDELYYHRDLKKYLYDCQQSNITIIPSRGWDMVSWQSPQPDVDIVKEVRKGVRKLRMDKIFAFNPNYIKDTHFSGGRHSALPEGDIKYPKSYDISLLHYRFIGLQNYLGRTMEKKKRNPYNYRNSYLYELADFLRNAWSAKKVSL